MNKTEMMVKEFITIAQDAEKMHDEYCTISPDVRRKYNKQYAIFVQRMAVKIGRAAAILSLIDDFDVICGDDPVNNVEPETYETYMDCRTVIDQLLWIVQGIAL